MPQTSEAEVQCEQMNFNEKSNLKMESIMTVKK
jgi:hypothetical protein